MALAPDLVFVYGTLKRGERNHDLLRTAEFVGPAFTEPRFRLIDCGPYPAMIEHFDEPLVISGEVYRIDDGVLLELDKLEDEGRLYRRKVVEVSLIDGGACDQSLRTARCWTYLWLNESHNLPLIDGASWSEAKSRR